MTTQKNKPTRSWMDMDLEFLARVRRTASIAGGIVAVPLATYFGISAGIAWVAGIIWSLVNLFFITALMKDVLTLDDRPVRRIVLTLLIKFPVLYAAGLLLLAVVRLPVGWLVAGFTWPFFVITMKGAGRAWLRLDEPRETGAETAPLEG